MKYPRTFLKSKRAATRSIDSFLDELRLDSQRGLHLGSGRRKLAGMINCDLFDPAADMRVDARDLGRFSDGSVDLIESHHMIEHLSLEDVDKAMAEWSRVIAEGGHLVVSCPDITRISLSWLKYYLLYPVYPRKGKLDYIKKMFVGSQENEGMFHRSVFSVRSMRNILKRHGFEPEFIHAPYSNRPTPTLIVIAKRKRN